MEYTSSYTPQYNGVVKRQIAVLKTKSQTMLTQACLQKSLHNSLWAKAVRCANTLENMTMTLTHLISPHCAYTGSESKLYSHLVEFG